MRLVLAAHAAHPRGLTDDELSGNLLPDEHPGSVSRRRGTLRDLGYIGDTGERRLTRWGRQAVVWRVTAAGLAAFEREG